jgi:hypothetical protein
VFLQFFKEGGEYNYTPIEVQNRGEEGVGRAFNDLAVFWRKDVVRG